MGKHDATSVIAVDLGGTNLLCAAMGLGGEIRHRTVRPAGAHLPPDGVVENAAEAIAETMAQDGTKIKAIGIGLPGIVYAEEGVWHNAANFPECRDLPLAARISEKFGLPTFLGHDVDLAALAEMHYGAGRGYKHLVCMTVGTGIGVGMILNGQPYTGSGYGAGNLGHMVVDQNVPADRLTEDGTLEKLSAAPAIRARAIEAVRGGAHSTLADQCNGDLGAIDAQMVFEAAEGGDVLCRGIIEEALRVLSIGIANLHNLLSPEVIIIGGGLAQAGEPFFRRITETVDRYVYHYPDLKLNIVPAQMGEDAVLGGAARLAWEQVCAASVPTG